jgi:hypothetical protein
MSDTRKLLDDDATTRFTHRDVTVELSRYRYARSQQARLADDGIVDPVAIERFVDGDPAPITYRELVCIIATLAVDGVDDASIAEQLGRSGKAATDWVCKIRSRHGIPSRYVPGDHVESKKEWFAA